MGLVHFISWRKDYSACNTCWFMGNEETRQACNNPEVCLICLFLLFSDYYYAQYTDSLVLLSSLFLITNFFSLEVHWHIGLINCLKEATGENRHSLPDIWNCLLSDQSWHLTTLLQRCLGHNIQHDWEIDFVCSTIHPLPASYKPGIHFYRHTSS